MQETKPRDPLLAEIKAGLARRDLTQSDLANHLSLSRGAIGRRLTGEVPFNIDELRRTATFLNVPLATLLDPTALAEGGDAA